MTTPTTGQVDAAKVQELKAARKELQNAARTSLLQGFGPVLLLTGAAFAARMTFRQVQATREQIRETATASRNQLKLSEQGQVADRYTQAVEQLGREKAPVRLGALYSLEHLAQSHVEYRETVVDVFCAYLRMPLPARNDPQAEQVEEAAQSADDRDRSPHAVPRQDPAQERQVRQTAQRILAAHLQLPEGTSSAEAQRRRPSPEETFWPGIMLDLTDAVLVNADFIGVSVVQTRFNGVTFQGDAQFTRATFHGDAQFDKASFQGNAKFDGVTFQSDAQFDEASFQGDAQFDEATFQGDAQFTRATFQGSTGFAKTTFQGVAWFGSTSHNHVSQATFESHARFAGAIFEGEAGFGGTTFKGSAEFHQASFQKMAWFEGATFKTHARFPSATFWREAGFGRATFKSSAGWFGVTFQGSAWFYEAAFQDNAYFRDTAFQDEADFDKATFGREADFGAAIFQGEASFQEATFQGDAWFGYAISGNSVNGAHVLHLDNPDFNTRQWPDGYVVRPDPADPTHGTLVPAEQAEGPQPAVPPSDETGR